MLCNLGQALVLWTSCFLVGFTYRVPVHIYPVWEFLHSKDLDLEHLAEMWRCYHSTMSSI